MRDFVFFGFLSRGFVEGRNKEKVFKELLTVRGPHLWPLFQLPKMQAPKEAKRKLFHLADYFNMIFLQGGLNT